MFQALLAEQRQLPVTDEISKGLKIGFLLERNCQNRVLWKVLSATKESYISPVNNVVPATDNALTIQIRLLVFTF